MFEHKHIVPVVLLLAVAVVVGCRPATAVSDPLIADNPASATASTPATAVPALTATPSATATLSTPTPTLTLSATPTATLPPTATVSPSPTPAPVCAERRPADADLLVLVTADYGLSPDYEPGDLVSLVDHLPFVVTRGYPSQVRAVILEPLLELIAAMQAAGLRPQVLSGYRSYAAQVIAWNKWNEQYPQHVGNISARPGHSEHQLGTVIDFGSPELPAVVGDPEVEFHTYFYKTSEGQWLAANAHKYGFTLSYPREAFEITGFFYEPWHYRYVGQEMATRLHTMDLSLTEYLLMQGPEPCPAP